MKLKLEGRRVAILVAHGFEQSELVEPRNALHVAGAETAVVAPAAGEVKAWNGALNGGDWGAHIAVDRSLAEAHVGDYDALLLPGGVMSPDTLRRNEHALDFVRGFFNAGKPVAAICHGPWTLIDAGVVEGRRITSWPSLESDLRNAGAAWIDAEVVVDHGLVSSRKPDDIPAFTQRMIEAFA